ncbi:MAG: dockerin type I repeat-containing protein [Clostridia bacterium]|nr:dockerin type I repeat-containing protein [Clostridia bacterium]
MKKIISLVLATILVLTTFPMVAFAAEMGDVNADGKISAVDARIVLQVVAGLQKKTDLKNPDGADVNGDNEISAVDARVILQKVAGLNTETPDTDKPSDSTLAQYIAVFNAESAKAAKGTYNWTRSCEFSKDIDVGNSTATLNKIIQMVDANADLNSVVGSFLGVGDSNGTQANAGKYAIIAMSLTEDDVESYTADAEQITLLLKNSKNPTAGGNTPFNHVSNDFVTEADVKNAIAGVTTAISVNSCSFNYNNVKVTARVGSDGKPVSLKISYTMYATMNLKAASMKIDGNGEVETVIKYTDLKY